VVVNGNASVGKTLTAPREVGDRYKEHPGHDRPGCLYYAVSLRSPVAPRVWFGLATSGPGDPPLVAVPVREDHQAQCPKRKE
jgi:hypothetical protein